MLTTKERRKAQKTISTQEVYNLWDTLVSKYESRTRLRIFVNYVHDIDLKYVIEGYVDAINATITEAETFLTKHRITGPSVGVLDVNTATNTEVLTDELIAKDVFLAKQGALEMYLRILRSTTTNDQLRAFFVRRIRTAMDLMDDVVVYLRLKGWLGVPPSYPNVPADIKEPLGAGDAFHLWDNLAFRYDNIHLTEIYSNAENDADLRILFTTGVQQILKKQAVRLEKECLRFGIPLPKHPPNVVSNLPSTELNDEFMYRQVASGIIGATLLHSSAMKQCTTNDRIRGFFKELLISEINLQNNLIRYGKLKGYVYESPVHKL